MKQKYSNSRYNKASTLEPLKLRLGFFLLFSLFVAGNAFGQTIYTWQGADNASWATATNWLPTRTTPASTDILQFNTGTTRTITAVPTQTIGNFIMSGNTNITLQATAGITLTIGNVAGTDLDVQSGSTLTMGTNVSITLNANATASIGGKLNINSGRTFNTNGTTVVTTVTGSIYCAGTLTCTTATKLLFNGTSQYQHDVEAVAIPTATWALKSTCLITGAKDAKNNGPALTANFGNLIWNCTGQTTENGANGTGTINIQGDFTLQSTGSTSFHFADSGGHIINGNFIQTGGIVEFKNAIAQPLDVIGDFRLSGGTFYTSNPNSTRTIQIGGNFYFTGGFLGGSDATHALIFEFNGTGIQTFKSGGAIMSSPNHIVNYIVDNASTLQMDLESTVVIGNAFTVNSGGTLGIRSNNGITTSGATGNVQTTTRTYSIGANYIYNGTTVAQAAGTGLPATVSNLTISNTAGVTFAALKAVTNNLSITTGAFLNPGTYTHTAGTLTLGGAGTAPGLWGSTSSGATYKTNVYFTAGTTGTVNTGGSSCTTGAWLGINGTDWNDPINWCGGIPTAATNVTIASTAPYQPIIGAAGGLCNNITIGSGASLTITGSNTLTVNGNWSNSGTFTANTSTVIYNGAAQIAAAVTYYNLILSGSGTKTITGVGTVNGNFTMSGDNTTKADTTVTLNVGGDLTVGSGNQLKLINGDPALSVTGNTIISGTVTSPGAAKTIGGNFTINSGGSWTESGDIPVYDINGNFLNNGTFSATKSPTYYIAGDFTNNNTFTAGSGSVTFDGSAQSIGGTSSTTFPNLTLSNTGTKTFGIGTTVTGLLTIKSVVKANLGTFTHTAVSLSLGGSPQGAGSSYGGTGSPAFNINPTFFAATTGIVNVGSCFTASLTSTAAAAAVCEGGAATINVVNSTTANLPIGTYAVNYTLTGTNTGSFISTMDVTSAGSGSFTTGTLSFTGSTTITIDYLRNGCVSLLSANNTATITVNPVIAGNTSGSAVSICNNTSTTLTGGTATGGSGAYTYLWESSDALAGTYAAATGTNNTVNYTTATLTTASTQVFFRRTVTSGGCTDVATGVQVTVRPAFVSGAIPTTGETICYNGNPGLIGSSTASSGGDSSITYKWQANGVDIASSNSATYDPPTGLTATTTYTRFAKDGNCNISFTQSTGTWTVTVSPVSVGGSIAGSTTVCAGPNSTLLTLSGYTGTINKWQSSTASDFSSAVTDIFITTTSQTVTNLSATTYYRAVIQSGSCAFAISAPATVTVSLSNTWEGTANSDWFTALNWSCGSLPTVTSDVIIPNVSPKPQPIVNDSSKIALANTLTVQPSSSLTVNSGNTLKVTDKFTNNGGTITFEDTASLVQTNDVVNTGNILYKRKTAVLNNNYDFVYWGSPVQEQPLGAIWMASTWNDTFYNYDPTIPGWARSTATTPMIAGKGYISRARNGQLGVDNQLFTVGNKWTATFSGVPNNGTIPVDCIAGRDCLLANPYPSAIDADTFLDLPQNTAVLEGTLYFWTHNTKINNNAYTSDDYASYNGVGGTKTTRSSISSGLNTNIPSGKIAAGQSFFATAKGTANVIFNNTMRVGAGGAPLANNQFFRTSNTKAKTANSIEKHRVWLNLSNTQGVFKQTLVGYVTDATNGYDNRFDGESFDGNTYVDFYSINQGKNFTIQGRAVPFDPNDTVPLGFKTTIEGSFTIDIDQVDGALTNQAVYLEDKVTNTVSNLKNGNYTFTTAKGTFNDRFVLRYTDKTLSIDETDKEDGILVFYSNNYKTLIVKNNRTDVPVKSVALFNITGQTIEKWDVKDNGQTNIQIPIKDRSSGVYIVKVKTTKGVSSKKIIVR